MRTSRSSRALLAAFAALGGFLSFANAQSVATTPVGAFSIPLLKSSDTIVAVPLQEASSYAGVTGVVTGSGSAWTIGVTASPSWATNAFQGFYYVRFTTGVKAGMYYTITSNGAQTVVVNSAGDDLSGVVGGTNGDKFEIYKHWTLNTLLPYNDSSKNPLTVSASTVANQRRSQVIIPDNSFAGINLPAQGTYYFTPTGWVKAVAGNPVANDTILYPDEYIIIRQPATVAADTALTVVGSVNTAPLALPLATRAAGTQDNALALTRPANVTLAQSGLASGFVESASTVANQRRDQLFVFDNTVVGFNKSAAKTYYRVGGQWIRAITGNPVADNDVLPAGSGFIIRKYQNASAAVAVAVNNPNY